MNNKRWIASVTAISMVGLLFSVPSALYAEDTIGAALTGGKLSASIRVRYEFVDQDGFSNDADAKTVRARLGYETGSYYGLSALAEIDGTTHLGDDDFNSKENGNTAYPVVADPDSFRLNRANLKYTGIPDTVVKAGRQRIILGDARFVGNVGWRQNEQTFDAIRITNKSLDQHEFNYIYAWQVNGILGSDGPYGDFDSDSHFLDATYRGFGFVDISAFGHWLDFEDGKEASSLATYGVRLNGKTKINDSMTALYGATFALQREHAENTADVDENHYAVMAGLKWNGFTAKAGYDVFEGNGTVAFQTPLATGHKFQGFADVFLSTPADGLENFHVSLGYKSKPFSIFSKGIAATITYHDFEAENSTTDMGSEFDAVIAVPLYDHVKVVTKYADYEGDGFAADRQKFMLGINFSF